VNYCEMYLRWGYIPIGFEFETYFREVEKLLPMWVTILEKKELVYAYMKIKIIMN